MPESVTTLFVATSTGATGPTRGTPLGATQEEPLVAIPTTGVRRMAVFPAFALSIFLSTASVLSDPRIIYPHDSSVTLSRQRPTRRGISLTEARNMALDTLLLAEHRRAKFAELEALQVATLYEWGNW